MESIETIIPEQQQFESVDYQESSKYKKRAQILAQNPLIEEERNVENERAELMELIDK